jgi:hypothetical protein
MKGKIPRVNWSFMITPFSIKVLQTKMGYKTIWSPLLNTTL